ncbi:hypothetical protein MKZ26_03295 [Sporosarcina sp. FSL K6-6792]|uniref:hypothetical protein n=1 Tax=Sporosarcina sp. FSL K6-6792 TaxID=2921559 RepID=UPI0030F90FDB
MKKLLMLLFAVMLLAACSADSQQTEEPKSDGALKQDETDKTEFAKENLEEAEPQPEVETEEPEPADGTREQDDQGDLYNSADPNNLSQKIINLVTDLAFNSSPSSYLYKEDISNFYDTQITLMNQVQEELDNLIGILTGEKPYEPYMVEIDIQVDILKRANKIDDLLRGKGNYDILENSEYLQEMEIFSKHLLLITTNYKWGSEQIKLRVEGEIEEHNARIDRIDGY